MFVKTWMHRSGQLLSVAVVASLTLSIAGCPATSPPSGDPPPGQTLDDDGDGVANGDDDCVDTPTGETANEIGCSASQRDTDGDGVMDDADNCASTPPTVTIDENGCPVGDPDALDGDGDDVGDDIDQCPDTAAREVVDPNGCALSQLDTDNDGVTDDADTCPGTPAGATANNEGCSPSQIDGGGGASVCGNNTQEPGESCDDGNTSDGDGCSSTCQVEVVGPVNNSCADPLIAQDGTQDFNNAGATTDGPDEPVMCDLDAGTTQIEVDIWYCYTATCSGEAVVSLCGSDFDTKMAIYNGCGCPADAALACSDDDCGSAFGTLDSRIALQVVEGQQYMIRIGGFDVDQQGDGRLTITCAPPACGTTSNDCFAETSDNLTGCGDAVCCETVCAVDQFCCDVRWDSFCASEAAGLCTDGFPACQVGIGSCQFPRDTGGCGTVDCCNTVCDADPFCCIDQWDASCVDEADALCFLSCGGRSGDCFSAHAGAGCSDVACCELVCPNDPFCCGTAWDADCKNAADQLCN